MRLSHHTSVRLNLSDTHGNIVLGNLLSIKALSLHRQERCILDSAAKSAGQTPDHLQNIAGACSPRGQATAWKQHCDVRTSILVSHSRLYFLSHHHIGLPREPFTTSLSKRNPAATDRATRRTRIISFAFWALAQLWHLIIDFFAPNCVLAIVSPKNNPPKFKICLRLFRLSIAAFAGPWLIGSRLMAKPSIPTSLWNFCERSSYIALNRIKGNLVNWPLFVATGGLLSPQYLIYGPP